MMKYATPQKLAIAAFILLTGSCSAPQQGSYFDPFENHPIQVKPVHARAEFVAPDPAAQMPPDEAARLGHFVADYLEHGHGTLTVSVPASVDSAKIITYFGQQLEALGIPERRIQVGTHDGGQNAQVWLQFLTYSIKAEGCGEWSDHVDFTLMNKPTKNFGCATQYNLAAQVDDPADLAAPRAMDGASGARRTDVITKYEKGSATANKSNSDSVKISNVGGSSS